MTNKKLIKTVKLTNDGTFSNQGVEDIVLEYFLISSMVGTDQDKAIKCYGIDIVKKETHTDNRVYIENKNVENISCCEKSVLGILKKMAQHTVTPMTMEDILLDMIDAIEIKDNPEGNVA